MRRTSAARIPSSLAATREAFSLDEEFFSAAYIQAEGTKTIGRYLRSRAWPGCLAIQRERDAPEVAVGKAREWVQVLDNKTKSRAFALLILKVLTQKVAGLDGNGLTGA
ncbi:MAG: hypothetical protein K0Q68_2150 [Moraxellaceae bacterium]|nr:hypothetical protein [Moraxellaceae bacterium]